MTDKHLDDAIDRAVREMMSGEPASDLRQRVLDDITAPQHRRFAWSTLAYSSAALAAIVLLVLSLVTRRPVVPETRIAGTPAAAPAAAQTTPSPVAAQSTAQPASSAPRRNHLRRCRARHHYRPPTRERHRSPREAASIAGELPLETRHDAR